MKYIFFKTKLLEMRYISQQDNLLKTQFEVSSRINCSKVKSLKSSSKSKASKEQIP